MVARCIRVHGCLDVGVAQTGEIDLTPCGSEVCDGRIRPVIEDAAANPTKHQRTRQNEGYDDANDEQSASSTGSLGLAQHLCHAHRLPDRERLWRAPTGKLWPLV